MFQFDVQILQIEDAHRSTLELFSLNSITWPQPTAVSPTRSRTSRR